MVWPMKDLYDIGEMPPLGQVPTYMHAQVVRQDRYGEPRQAYRVERVEVPDIGPGEVLVYVMATGINYSGIWAALGSPLDVIQVRQRAGEPWDFHIGGSDCSGVVYAVGEGVTSVKVGDHVVTHPGWWDPDDPFVQAGGDGTLSSTMKIWGYETTWGSFAQFARAQAHQCLPKPEGLTWEAAASYMLVGSTAYRMLNGWPPHIVQPGDIVLVWGGAGGLGVMAIQLVKEMGGLPVAVVSNEERGEHCNRLGAVGYIDRGDYDHWGVMPRWSDDEAYGRWLKGAPGRRPCRLGRRWRAQESPHRVRAPGARTPCPPPSSSAIRAAWWSYAPVPPATTSPQTCATTGYARSVSRAPMQPTMPRPPPSTGWSRTARSTPASRGSSHFRTSLWQTNLCATTSTPPATWRP